MSLEFAPDAFPSLPREETRRLMNKIDWLWLNREYVTHEPLSQNLSSFYKHRLGKYRILYTYDNKTDIMRICMVGLRDTIYKDADKRFRP